VVDLANAKGERLVVKLRKAVIAEIDGRRDPFPR
jgi:hypothetical protein